MTVGTVLTVMTVGTVLTVIFYCSFLVLAVVFIVAFRCDLLQFWSSLWSSFQLLLMICCKTGPACGPEVRLKGKFATELDAAVVPTVIHGGIL